jgi:hypothetical protein
MRVIGQVTSTTGTQRKRDFVLEAARRKANRADRKVLANGGSLTTGATNIVAVAESTIQRTFARVPGAVVSVGKPSQDYYDRTTKV